MKAALILFVLCMSALCKIEKHYHYHFNKKGKNQHHLYSGNYLSMAYLLTQLDDSHFMPDDKAAISILYKRLTKGDDSYDQFVGEIHQIYDLGSDLCLDICRQLDEMVPMHYQLSFHGIC